MVCPNIKKYLGEWRLLRPFSRYRRFNDYPSEIFFKYVTFDDREQYRSWVKKRICHSESLVYSAGQDDIYETYPINKIVDCIDGDCHRLIKEGKTVFKANLNPDTIIKKVYQFTCHFRYYMITSLGNSFHVFTTKSRYKQTAIEALEELEERLIIAAFKLKNSQITNYIRMDILYSVIY